VIAEATTKAKATSRSVRVWIEGNKLIKAGFLPDTPYQITHRRSSVTLELSEDGERRVTKATRNGKPRPIIDLHDSKIAAAFPAGTEVVVRYYDGVIIFSKKTNQNNVALEESNA
jgi:hypothetical protein